MVKIVKVLGTDGLYAYLAKYKLELSPEIEQRLEGYVDWHIVMGVRV